MVKNADGILGTLLNIRGGRAAAELELELGKVVEAVRKTRNKGSVTLKLTVMMMEGDAGGTQAPRLDVMEEINSKVPQPDHGPTCFFADHNNRLVTRDPDQKTLEEMTIGRPLEGLTSDSRPVNAL